MNQESSSRQKCVAVLLLLATLLISTATVSFAWFTEQEPVIGVDARSAVSYFADGTGAANDPYIINRPQHLYNLSWLQNRGYFDGETNYFELAADLDMAGELDNGELISGAIPPIGSEANPFRGHFDGKGYTISNLWVSSDPNDWKEKPATTQAVGTQIGLFGAVVRPANDTTSLIYVGNFILENIEVTTNCLTSTVGIVAGYVDGAMSKIGVKNGIITVKNGSSKSTVKSGFVLIGEISDGTVWEDIPGYEGNGDLVIAPSGLGETETSTVLYPALPNGAITNHTEVAGSASGSAYYQSTLTRISLSPSASGFYVYNNATPLSFSNTTITMSNALATDISTTNPDTLYKDRTFYDYCLNTLSSSNANSYYRVENAAYGVFCGPIPNGNKPATPPSFSGVTGSNTYPTNGIWFQPQNAGECYISFVRQNNSRELCSSLYRYKRNNTGAIISGTLEEMRFSFPPSALNNGNVVTFIIKLEPDDIEYEYVIGASGETTRTSHLSAPLFFLKLAGNDTSGSSVEGGLVRMLDQVEFITADKSIATAFPAGEDYTPINSHLAIEDYEGSAVSVTDEFRFCRDTVSDKVHYKPSDVTEKITTDAQSEYDDDYSYPERDDGSS